MVTVMLLPMGSTVSAVLEEESVPPSIESILDDYYKRIFDEQSKANANISTYSNSDNRFNEIKQETITSLCDAGYLAYDVNPDTYNEIEEELKTDFGQINLEPTGSYIVIVSGEDDGAGASNAAKSLSSDGTASTSFTYEYSGHTLTMRYLTVTAANYSKLGMTDYVSLKAESSDSLNRVINTALSVAMDSVFSPIPIGTIASLFGDIITWKDSQRATFLYFAGTNWTRVYTQVLEESNIWLSWLRVEYVTTANWVTGSVYNSRTNSYEPVKTNRTVHREYTEHYSDTRWRKLQAAIAWFRGSFGINERIGDVYYSYGNSTLITHREPV